MDDAYEAAGVARAAGPAAGVLEEAEAPSIA